MTKRKMSDVLWEAANKYLQACDQGCRRFSCNAALAAEFKGKELEFLIGVGRDRADTDKFLRSLGCVTSGDRGKFLNYRVGAERQGVRYLWLVLAATVAEDEGVML